MTLVREQWHDLLRVIGCSMFAVFQSLFAVFALSYGTSKNLDLDREVLLWVSVAANAVAVVAIPVWAALSDRIGRRPVRVFGALSSAATFVAYLWALGTGHMPLIFVLGILHAGLAYSTANGI